MSLLWIDKIKKNLIKISERSSPKHNKYIPCFAQSKFPYINNKIPVFSRENPLMKCQSIKGISLFISGRRSIEGSMTVEASIVLPLFLFFFLNLSCAIEMIRLHGNLELAMWDVGNQISIYGHALTWEDSSSDSMEDTTWADVVGVIMSGTYVKGQIVDYLGEEYLENSPLREGVDSFLFLESGISETEDTFKLVVTYAVAPFGSVSGFKAFRMANQYYGHFWNGYAIPVDAGSQEQYVYVTENGTVYHLEEECTYLKLSIRRVSFQEALDSQNASGIRYAACQKCCEGICMGDVYITSEGKCYHFERDCPGLKRTVYCVENSHVSGLELCSRCARKNSV